ncbi:MAG: winged helix-turn-helix transcriptional regulator [Desulfobacterales bacterium]|nr:winged helix-turn-helix transcriptional regulator [Desulfobacterales bacterium]MDJ0915103.1 winged helix-turn-helix transcriptional regulator [Desulfobacterales bacterium]
MLTILEKKIIAAIQADIPVAHRPYQKIAQNLNVSEETLLEKLKDLCEKGVIRRFGATLRHQKSGYAANAMVAWKVDEHNITQVGQQFAAFKEVSHCYRRNPTLEWPYNLYTMVHAKDEESCRQTARRMAAKASVKDYNLLFSRRELKKTSMNYFPAHNDD